MSPADPFGLVGQVLDGQFRVDRFVGEGGFSIVYRGTHVGLAEPIAIKCLKLPTTLGSALVESFVRRFRDESRIHYKLSQGNLYIVRAIASGTTIAPATSALVPYAVLEWLEGTSLADDFSQRRAQGMRGRSVDDTVRLLDSAVDAVAYAHAQGVVHRDLNPGNLFLAKTLGGIKLKVLDFGVAKIMTDSALAIGPTARTLGNVRMFAPSYGAPEQFDERIGAIGPWTDVYALALVTLEALSDRTVREGEHLGQLAAKALDAANRPTPRAFGIAVGDEVEAVLSRATAIAPSERIRDAGEFWGMLKHAVRTDAESGRAPFSHPQEEIEPAPQTLRLDQALPAMVAPPAVEVTRSPSAPPRGLGGTIRMRAPATGSEALAQTPLQSSPPPAYASSPPPAPVIAPPPAPVSYYPQSVPAEPSEAPSIPRSSASRVVLLLVALVASAALVAVVLLLFAHRGAR